MLSYFVDNVNFTVFWKAVTSEAYKISSCKGAFLKEQLFLFVILIYIFFWPTKSECARAKLVSAIAHVFPFFAVLIIPDLIHTIFAKTLVLIFRTTHLIHIWSAYYWKISFVYIKKKIDLLLFAAARGNLNSGSVLFSLHVTQVK